jgi:UDP-N-acetylglucosamine:LPS N-acetylglucosamine transferase
MDEAGGALKVLVLSAAMGGGHLQISRELARRLQARGDTAIVVDMLDLMPPPTGRFLHWVYPWLVGSAPRLYQRVYDTFFVADQQAGERAGIPVRLALPGLRRLVADFDPDVAVSTYPLSALALGHLRQRGDLHCPSVTVVTTFSLNNLWIHPANDLEVCISDQAAADATARTGRTALVSGPVIRPEFLDPPMPRAEARARLGLPSEGRVAVLTTGSVGLAGDVEDAAASLARHPGWTPVVLCGRSEDLRRRLAAIPGVHTLDWVDDMPAVLAAADVLVDNAGGMSSKEALGFGLPVVTFRPLSGHGRDDAEAMARLAVTDLVSEESELLRAVDALVGDPALREGRIKRGQALFVQDLAEIVEQAAG